MKPLLNTLVYTALYFSFTEKNVFVSSQNQQQNLLGLLYNKTIAWGNFFDAFPALWTGSNKALTEASDLTPFYNQIQQIFQTGFGDPSTQVSASTPRLDVYQTEVRRALVYVGLPGTINIVMSTSPNIINYGILKPFPLFFNKTGGLMGMTPLDAIWYVGSNVCLTRTQASYDNPEPIKNVTYCTTSRDEGHMNAICWLPKLSNGDRGTAVSAMKYTTSYSCCTGNSLPVIPTMVPKEFSLFDILTSLERPNPTDYRVCQSDLAS